MKRVLAFSLAAFAGFLFAVLALGVVLHVHPVRAGAPTGAGGTGDTNGDGVVDVSDAIFTLLYLFKGGPAPVACADSPELVGRVAALEDTNARIASALEELAHPCSGRADRFHDNGDGTVTDSCTGLMWQQKTNDLDGDGLLNNSDTLTWQQATTFCRDLTDSSFDDWRLPTLAELRELVLVPPPADQTPWSPPGAAFQLFQGTHWTATEHAAFPVAAWACCFSCGSDLSADGKENHRFVLAVRGPLAP